jgi:hypothetical protein
MHLKKQKNFMATFSIHTIASVFFMGPFIEEWPTSKVACAFV